MRIYIHLKCEVILNLAPAKDLTEIRHIIGLASYFGKFVAHFSNKVKPLNIQGKKTRFNWSPLFQQRLNIVKAALTNSPILIFLYLNEPYVLFTDASKHIWSGVLTKECITTIID